MLINDFCLLYAHAQGLDLDIPTYLYGFGILTCYISCQTYYERLNINNWRILKIYRTLETFNTGGETFFSYSGLIKVPIYKGMLGDKYFLLVTKSFRHSNIVTWNGLKSVVGKFYHPPSHHKISTEIFQKGNNLPNHFQWLKNVFLLFSMPF